MDSYHGTSTLNARLLAGGRVDVSVGGGELGRGFYTGEHLHEAKAWAFHQSGDRQRNVVRFSTADSSIDALSFAVLDYSSASLRRHYIKRSGATRTYLFGRDMIWAPIVGSARAIGDQYKWESTLAERLLNDPATPKQIL